MKRRSLLKVFSVVATGAALTLSAGAHAEDKVIKVGTVAGPDAQVWQVVQKVAKEKQGLNVKVIEFNDYVQPNAALDAGDLDANSFQHQPYLDSQVKQRGYKIVSAGLTYISPIGVYSKKFKALKDLPQGAKLAVPNDPSNENRALLLLQTQGVIKLKAGAGTGGNNATVLDIAENPKKLKISELDAAQLPRVLSDVDAAVINTNYALAANLQPTKDAIALESLTSPYANLIAVGEEAGQRVPVAGSARIHQEAVQGLDGRVVLNAAHRSDCRPEGPAARRPFFIGAGAGPWPLAARAATGTFI
ncbi:Methionine ABC transporter substrate-binding protein [Burkholderia vietnamiensis]|nr:Methionine ABC transporter substrate-binding protein [Burkholderia vietnamiensis]